MMQTIIAPASRLKLRLTNSSGHNEKTKKNSNYPSPPPGSGGGGGKKAYYPPTGMLVKKTTTTITPPTADVVSSHHHHYHDDSVEAKLAYTACLDALQTLTTYLRKEVGIQLHVRPDEENLVQILQRAHDYCDRIDPCFATTNTNSTTTTTLVLLLSCWKSVYTYTAVAHHRSWRQFQHCKHFTSNSNANGSSGGGNNNNNNNNSSIGTGGNTTNTMASGGGGELNHYSYQHKPHHDDEQPLQQQQYSSSHHQVQNKNHNSNNNNAGLPTTNLDQALQQTIRYAEDCSTCQRQVFLLQRKWCRDQQEQLPYPVVVVPAISTDHGTATIAPPPQQQQQQQQQQTQQPEQHPAHDTDDR